MESITKKCCQNCIHARAVDAKHGQYICVRFPPTPLLVPQHNQMTGESGMAITSHFPPVSGDSVCGEVVVAGSGDRH